MALTITAMLDQYPPNTFIGSWITTHELLRHLAGRGHRVTAIAARAQRRDYTIDGVTVICGHRGRTALDDIVRQADIAVCHGGDRATARLGPPTVRIVHNTAVADTTGDALTVYNSDALADACNAAAPAMVVHPPVDADRYRTTPGDAVTIIGCSEAKGINTVWRCATALPARTFIAVRGGYGQQLQPRALNMTTVASTGDMRSIYGRTRILAMPSANETWGRTAIEAMVSGIPVIAHPSAGLVEACGTAGTFIDRNDTAGWIAEIERLHDPAEWATASKRALARVAELDTAGDVDRFAVAVESLHHEGART